MIHNLILKEVKGVWSVYTDTYPNSKKIETLSEKNLISAWEYTIKKYPDNWVEVTHKGHTGYLMTLKDWLECCENGSFIDDDGFGDVLDNDIFLSEYSWIYPSERSSITKGTHILWYNK